VTNYIHMLALGHISEYLIYWGYLYDHLQQGWGAFNSLIKTFLFCRTGCGRAGNKGHGSKSQLHPIAHWLSYCVILCGYLYHDIVEQNKKYTRLALSFLMILLSWKNLKVTKIQMKVMIYMYGKTFKILKYFAILTISIIAMNAFCHKCKICIWNHSASEFGRLHGFCLNAVIVYTMNYKNMTCICISKLIFNHLRKCIWVLTSNRFL